MCAAPERTARRRTVRQKVTVLGTGCVGASIGLALRQSRDADHLTIVGHDRDPGIARRAQALGAFDDVLLNLDLALQDSQLIVVAVPLAALRETLQDVGRLLDPNTGAVITDTGPLKRPVLTWAEAMLPAGVHYVGGDPFLAPGTGGWEPLRGLSDASGELFRDAVYAVTMRADDHPSAVRTVSNLALVLGATPLLMDPDEHDAVRLVGSTVPALVAAALFEATAEMPGWEEVRRAAGRTFATATAGASGDVASTRMAALLGRETVLRGLDAVMDRLGEMRAKLTEGDSEALEAELTSALEGRARWMLESQARSWQLGQQTPEQGSLFERTLQVLLGEGVVGRSDKQTRDR